MNRRSLRSLNISRAGAEHINSGLIEQTGGVLSWVLPSTSSFTTTGTITIGGIFSLAGAGSFTNFSDGTLSGGTYELSGRFRFADANISRIAANLILDGQGGGIQDLSGNDALADFSEIAPEGILSLRGEKILETSGGLVNEGQVFLDTDSQLSVGGTFEQSSGGTFLTGGTLAASGGVEIRGGVLAGTGTVEADLLNLSVVSPGMGGSAGTLVIVGDYTQGSTGSLHIELGGTDASKFDRLVISGTASLGGYLNVMLLNDFLPEGGDEFAILTFDSVLGDFAVINGLDLGDGRELNPLFRRPDHGNLPRTGLS